MHACACLCAGRGGFVLVGALREAAGEDDRAWGPLRQPKKV